jgi:hypothetical protein
LKAANAFWNPQYFSSDTRTITKPLIYFSNQQLRQEIRSLVYLAIVTNRSLIIPNVLGNKEEMPAYKYHLYKKKAMWPGFRVVYVPSEFSIKVNVLEPSFYWRMRRDFSDGINIIVPEPLIVSFHTPNFLRTIEEKLLSKTINNFPRIILQFQSKENEREDNYERELEKLKSWSSDSVGSYDDFISEKDKYGVIPLLSYKREAKQVRFLKLAHEIVQNIRLCESIFVPDRGNRSCFDKCD